ncbi:MAG: biotin transporter BioY, partial [Oscillospiraceae bacterium]
ALIVGFITKKWGYSFVKMCVAMLLGVAVCYAFGTAWFMAITHSDLLTTLGWCVFPFIPGDFVKIALAAFLSLKLRPIILKIAPAISSLEKEA